MGDLTIMEVLKLFAPIIILELGMKIFSLFLIWKKGVKNLSKVVWSIIVVVINIFGPIAFLLFGRRRDYID